MKAHRREEHENEKSGAKEIEHEPEETSQKTTDGEKNAEIVLSIEENAENNTYAQRAQKH